MKPTLGGDTKTIPVPPSDIKIIAKWYREQLDDILLDVVGVKKVNVSISDDNKYIIIKCTLLPKTKEEDCEMLADPDDDGNHPITYKGKQYIVIGKLVSSYLIKT